MKYLLIIHIIRIILCDCSDNPFLTQFQNLINVLEMNSTGYNSYLSNTPKDQSLNICTDQQTQSCCTTDTEEYFSEIIIKYQDKLLDNYSQLQEILNQFENDLSICGLTKNITFEESLIGNDQISIYKNLLIELARIQAGFLQGNLCILCTTSTNTTYISNNKMIVLQSSYDTYISLATNQYENIISRVNNFRQYILEYYVNYANTLNCSGTLQSFLDTWQNVVVCPGNDCQSFIENSIIPLGFRQLSVNDYYVFNTSSGLDIYLDIQSVSLSKLFFINLIILLFIL